MKKIVGVLLVSATLLFSACSNDKKAESTDATSKQETKASSTEDSKEKAAAEAKKKAEEAEKKKQEEIAKKVTEADTAMKAAEANLTDETLSAAKSAIEAIPGGNNELAKRLETATANLTAIKQQAATQEAQQAQQNQVQNDADGNGIPDDSPYNNTTPEERARGAQMEAEANAQWHQGQENIQNGVDPNGNELLPGQDHAAGSNPDGTPDAWVQGQLDRITPDGGYRTDDGVIYPE
ncbi:hypothetical protein P7D98_11210 [Enterococcus avium]|uniref:hypothetical protein n=1 Tax=Enterococcus avium TaxID=33945 RepID=UPI00288EA75A|nr:hypothetical protein [Enterococcus avium]MDT2437292.1 hypothetical protein [Enterococcus avium]MDT2466276.1 hypothetical protein [Enterococcus avium]MDT2485805.1 hypothetical protein [Enterococcus avium]MDT2505651.1 hypothetical protein [Enterococcus avium]MDT2512395.1 hypothetical protein [Enterococcus avium]